MPAVVSEGVTVASCSVVFIKPVCFSSFPHSSCWSIPAFIPHAFPPHHHLIAVPDSFSQEQPEFSVIYMFIVITDVE